MPRQLRQDRHPPALLRHRRRTPPASLDEFDWRSFQQEYRDYIDLATLAQLIPVIGAPVGVVANNRLIRKLGYTAMNACRMRWLEDAADLRLSAEARQ